MYQRTVLQYIADNTVFCFTVYFSSTDPERWTNIPLLVKIFKLIINELSTVVEANASRANAADWSQGELLD